MSRPLPELPGVEHSFVEAGGLSVHVAEAGSGEPLLMLHGWPQNWWEWHGLIPGLAERYRVICPDLRGFGWSDAPRRGYEKERLASDVAALLDRLGLSGVRLVGHDWGGVVGFILCVRRPDLVSRYLALNTGHLWPRVERRRSLRDMRRFWYQWVISTPGVGHAAVRLLAQLPGERSWRITGRSDAWSEADTRIYLDQFRDWPRVRATVQTYRSFLLRELGPLLRGRYRSERLRTPTLWLHGKDDVVLRPHMIEGCADHADQFELELVDGAGHFIADERPELVVERALEFFGR